MEKNSTRTPKKIDNKQEQKKEEKNISPAKEVSAPLVEPVIGKTIKAVGKAGEEIVDAADDVLGCGCSLILFIGLAGLIGTTSLVGVAVNLI